MLGVCWYLRVYRGLSRNLGCFVAKSAPRNDGIYAKSASRNEGIYVKSASRNRVGVSSDDIYASLPRNLNQTLVALAMVSGVQTGASRQ